MGELGQPNFPQIAYFLETKNNYNGMKILSLCPPGQQTVYLPGMASLIT